MLKNGIRFPSCALLEENYLTTRKLLQWTVSRIEIEYTDYQFSRVGTTVEQE